MFFLFVFLLKWLKRMILFQSEETSFESKCNYREADLKCILLLSIRSKIQSRKKSSENNQDKFLMSATNTRDNFIFITR